MTMMADYGKGPSRLRIAPNHPEFKILGKPRKYAKSPENFSGPSEILQESPLNSPLSPQFSPEIPYIHPNSPKIAEISSNSWEPATQNQPDGGAASSIVWRTGKGGGSKLRRAIGDDSEVVVPDR